MARIIMLALDGEAIPMSAIRVSPQMQIETEDKSGQSSGTATSEKGIKAKELRVSGLIPFSETALLTRIFKLAEAKGANGAAKRYRIANAVAQAINMREGIFSGSVDANEQDNIQAWLVNFTLREQDSVAEKASSRNAGQVKTRTQNSTGSTEGGTSEEEKNLNWLERNILKPADDALGGVFK